MKTLGAIAATFLSVLPLAAQQAELSAAQYIAAVKAAAPQGACFIRVEMEHATAGGAGQKLQVQIKRRDLGAGKAEHLYQVLFPKERRGESVLLRINGSKFSGAEFLPGKSVTPLKASDRHDPLLGTDLTVDDLMADFLDWTDQKIVGQEKVDGTACVIIESSDGSSKVKSWVDQKRYVAMKAEVYSPKLRRTIHSVTARQVSSGRYAPVKFSVTTAANGSTTQVKGSDFQDDITYTDADFTEEAMQQLTRPKK
jgi:hypothetical protein